MLWIDRIYLAFIRCGWVLISGFVLMTLCGCSHTAKADRSSVTLVIESNPTNLDPRFATDGQSQHLDGLIFSSLVERDEQMNLRGDLADSWDTPDPLTYVFHLRQDVHFHDGSAVTAKDVKATFDFILNAANHSAKRGAFRMIASIEAPDARTVIFHLKEPYASFLWTVSRPAIGIVPADASANLSRGLIGSGPFRFVSQAQDDEVVLAANTNYFGGAPDISRLRARVVPDAIVRALELRKGSADLEISWRGGRSSAYPNVLEQTWRISASTWTTRLSDDGKCGRRWHTRRIARC